MNRSPQQGLIRLLLVGIAALVPAAVAMQFVRAASAPTAQLRGTVKSASLLLAQNTGDTTSRASASKRANRSPIIAVLYTDGSAKVSWNGREFALENGSYAYIGGEIVQMGPRSIGLLQLGDGSEIYACGGSSISISRTDSGAYALDITRGSSRFVFEADTDFRVRANNAQVSPPSAVAAAGGVMFEGEVQARADGGARVCVLSRNLQVSAFGARNASAPIDASMAEAASPQPGAGVARIIEVAPAKAGAKISTTPIPAAAMPASLGVGATPDSAFLCRCRDLKEKLDGLAEAQRVAATAPADARATTAPPVAPPEAPPVVLAVPGIPDPFDPNVLPPPAAGVPAEPVVVVAPPAVPISGSGGGTVASPS